MFQLGVLGIGLVIMTNGCASIDTDKDKEAKAAKAAEEREAFTEWFAENWWTLPFYFWPQNYSP